MLFNSYKQCCKECDVKLWSDYSKIKGVCPDCVDIDSNEPLDLEDQLDRLYEVESD